MTSTTEPTTPASHNGAAAPASTSGAAEPASTSGAAAPAVELVAPDSLTAEMVGHWTYLMVEGAAFAMQGMHPTIKAVTDEFSVSRTDPLGRAIRSVDSVLRWTYGGEEAITEGARLRSLHQPLQVRDTNGKVRSALNPEAYQWVIATAYITTAKAGPLLVGREFTAAELDDLLADNLRIARILQVPMKGYPQTRVEFDAYYERMVAEVLVADDDTKEQFRQLATGDLDQLRAKPRVVRKALRFAMAPMLRFNYLSIGGLLDPRLRELVGIEWRDEDQRQLERTYAMIRLAYRILPDRLTYFPIAYHARKHHQCIEAMKQRELKSAAYRVRPKQ